MCIRDSSREGGPDLVIAAEPLGLLAPKGLLVAVVERGGAADGQQQDEGDDRAGVADLRGDAGHVVVADEGHRD